MPSLTDRFKEHWLISLILLCTAVAGATWALALSILVAPRDFEIARLERELAKAKVPTLEPVDLQVLPKSGVMAGTAVTTTDGICNIFIESIAGDESSATVTCQSGASRKFERVRPGARLAVQTPSATYVVDILGIRGNWLDVAVSRHTRTPPSPR